ncbi:hypothetical protein ACJIZ3_002282 [Penstemon smallii]|uniref:UDP-N-acetylmuramate dehydrogenase n=1 Tax=Penstemon smallii TaxID=265156 RepID=A0ABD3U606_9LAMI
MTPNQIPENQGPSNPAFFSRLQAMHIFGNLMRILLVYSLYHYLSQSRASVELFIFSCLAPSSILLLHFQKPWKGMPLSNTQVALSVINGGITALYFILWGKGLNSCGPFRLNYRVVFELNKRTSYHFTFAERKWNVVAFILYSLTNYKSKAYCSRAILAEYSVAILGVLSADLYEIQTEKFVGVEEEVFGVKDMIVPVMAGILSALTTMIARRVSLKNQLKSRLHAITIASATCLLFPVALWDMAIGSTSVEFSFSAWVFSSFSIFGIILIFYVDSLAEESFIHSNISNQNKLQFIREEKLLSKLSTWGIGGPCKYFVQVFDQHQLASAIRYCNEEGMKYIVIGKGSNCLFDDLGFDGCVILNRIEFLERIEPGLYKVGSGYPFNRLGVQSVKEGFTGLEFAGGIPGTVGGAAYMNAGANGQETGDVVECVEMITKEGEYRVMERSELSFGYRISPFQGMKDLAAITCVTFRLKCSNSARKMQQEYLKRRKLTQPVGERNAGSVFRNPPGFSAAQLIDRAELKGFKVGGAMISNKHANFFQNCGGATSKDMLELIGLAKEKVREQFGVELKQEILYIHP